MEESMNEAKAEKVGNKIIELLDLELKDGTVNTAYGRKTPIGLAQMIDDTLSYWDDES